MRIRGKRLVIYMDNMLPVLLYLDVTNGSSGHLIQEHGYIALFLLENLGFIVNNTKILTRPLLTYQDYHEFTVYGIKPLAGKTTKKIRTEAQHLLATLNIPAQSLA